jgi:hypothetical protein
MTSGPLLHSEDQWLSRSKTFVAVAHAIAD